MPGGRAILRALDLQQAQRPVTPESRVTLKTIDGQVIVRPPAPNSFACCNKAGERVVEAWLSDEGKAAWDRGEDIDFHKGHIWGMGDMRRIAMAEF